MTDGTLTQDQSQVKQAPTVNPPIAPPSISGGREQEPLGRTMNPNGEASNTVVDGITAAPTEVPLSPELKTIGVEQGSDNEPLLTDEIKKAGVTASVQTDPVVAATTTTLPLPKTFEQAKEDFKRSKFKDGLKWLAALIMYQWRRINPVKYNK